MAIEIQCRNCGKVYETKPGDVISGKWRLCPNCRPQDGTPPATSTKPIAEPAAA